MKNKKYWLRNNQHKLKNITGILLILLSVCGILYWENYGRERFNYVDAIVLNRDVSAGQRIESDMLGTIKMNREAAISNAVMSESELNGKSAVCYIPAGIQLPQKFFENKELTPGNGKYVLQLPQDWIYAFPQTLRRGDRVYFHAVKDMADDGVNAYQSTLYGQEYQDDRELPEGKEEQVIKEDRENIAEGLQPVYNTLVAYVKDSGNREVIDTVPERMDGSAVISRVEIITDDAGYQKLKSLFDKGYRFILMYD